MTTEISIFTEQGFATTFKIAEAMVKSGILPRGIDNPYKAFAIIQKGREMGVEPMRALTGIYLIEGKTVVSPELKLECFRARGGKVQWLDSSEKLAHVKLTSPDGTEHEERVTIAEMAAAGLTGKDNWRKYPKSMLRARCIAFALRAMGEGDGSYTPDELGAETTEAGEYIPPPVKESASRIAGTHGDSAGPLEQSTRTASAHASSAGTTTSFSHTAVVGTAKPASSESADLDADWREAPAPAPKPRTAADVKPTGGPVTPAQVKLVHVLKGQVGGVFSGDGSDPRDKWSKTLGVYRKEDGSRCAHTNELSSDQCSHLIDRMQGYIEKQGARAAGGVDLDAAVPARPSTSMDDLLQKAFDTDDEQSEWLRGLFGLEHVKELEQKETETALQLLICMSQGPDVYDTALTQARERGLVR